MPIFSRKRSAPESDPPTDGCRYGLLFLALVFVAWHLLGALAGITASRVLATYQGKPVVSIAMNLTFFLAFTACLPGLLKRNREALLVMLGLIGMNVLYGWFDALVLHPRTSLPTTTLAGAIFFVVYTSIILPRIIRHRHSRFRIEKTHEQ